MQSMRDTAPDVLRKILASQPTTEAKVLFAWRMAAGPAMARAARAAWTPDGILRLTPADPAWRREIRRARGTLVARLQHWLSAEIVRTIVIESFSEPEPVSHA